MKKNLFKLSFLLVAAATVLFNGCKKDLITSPKTPTAVPNVQAATNSKMVLFPGRGWVQASQVHLIERGYYLMRQNGHIFKLKKGTNQVVEDFGEVPETKPVNNVNANHTIADNSLHKSGIILNDKSQLPEASGTSNNWATYAQWQNPNHATPINYFSTTWTVPGPPQTIANQSIFLFNGLSDTTSAGDVIQPVLGWGPATGGGGNFWGISNSYAAGLTFYAYTAIDTVSSGEVITGVIRYNGQVNGSYNYTSSFIGFADSLILVDGNHYDKSNNIAPFIPELNLAYETLENYSVGHGGVPQSPNDYPQQDSTRLTAINLKVGSSNPTLNWTTANSPDAAPGQKTVVNTHNPNGAVDIYFHAQQPPEISYTTPDAFTVGIAISPLNPTNSDGTPNTYSVSPTLPAGLSMNSSTGIISGTPTTVSSATNYTITAHNAAGSGTFVISIVVGNTYPFVVSSHSTSTTIYNLVFNGNTVTSGDLVSSNEINNLNLVYTLNSNSTVVMQVPSGYMPVNAQLYGNFAPINGTISGTNITFTGVNLNGAQCHIVIN